MRTAALAAAALLGGCSGEAPQPQPSATPTAAIATPAPMPTHVLAPGDLPAPELDAGTAAAGQWRFKASATGAAALFGGDASDAIFAVRCDPQARRIVFARNHAALGGGRRMRLVTDTAAASFPVEVRSDASPMVEAVTSADDSFLKALAAAKGRIGVGIDEAPMLVLPGHPAIGNVVDGCRRPR